MTLDEMNSTSYHLIAIIDIKLHSKFSVNPANIVYAKETYRRHELIRCVTVAAWASNRNEKGNISWYQHLSKREDTGQLEENEENICKKI